MNYVYCMKTTPKLSGSLIPEISKSILFALDFYVNQKKAGDYLMTWHAMYLKKTKHDHKCVIQLEKTHKLRQLDRPLDDTLCADL